MLSQNYPVVQGVRGERWKYMRYWPNRPVPEDYRDVLNLGLSGEEPAYEELFDLQTDPTETTNLAGDPAYADQLERMRRRCVELLREALGRRPDAPRASQTVEWRAEMREYDQALDAARGTR